MAVVHAEHTVSSGLLQRDSGHRQAGGRFESACTAVKNVTAAGHREYRFDLWHSQSTVQYLDRDGPPPDWHCGGGASDCKPSVIGVEDLIL